MSADLLRRAAKVLRERAEAATPGPWRTEHHSEPDRDLEHYLILGVTNRHQVTPIPLRTMTEDGGFHSQAEADVAYGALMHPPVALALADFLTSVADFDEQHGYQVPPASPLLVLARAILREPEAVEPR